LTVTCSTPREDDLHGRALRQDRQRRWRLVAEPVPEHEHLLSDWRIAIDDEEPSWRTRLARLLHLPNDDGPTLHLQCDVDV
jgi:hypothetical protein